jgi:hypothetical protein
VGKPNIKNTAEAAPEETIRTYIRNQEMADKQLDQMRFKLASSESPVSCTKILKSLITAYGGSPSNPPALLGVIGSPRVAYAYV